MAIAGSIYIAGDAFYLRFRSTMYRRGFELATTKTLSHRQPPSYKKLASQTWRRCSPATKANAVEAQLFCHFFSR